MARCQALTALLLDHHEPPEFYFNYDLLFPLIPAAPTRVGEYQPPESSRAAPEL